MDIKIVIGKVHTEGYNWPVYLRELDSDAGPLVQIGDSDAEDDCFNSLEKFMRMYGETFTAIGAMTPEPPSLEARREKAVKLLETAQEAQHDYWDAVRALEVGLAALCGDSVEIEDDILDTVSDLDSLIEYLQLEVKK